MEEIKKNKVPTEQELMSLLKENLKDLNSLLYSAKTFNIEISLWIADNIATYKVMKEIT